MDREQIIESALENVRNGYKEITGTLFFGDFNLAPQNLVCVFICPTDEALNELKSKFTEIAKMCKEELIKGGYEEDAFNKNADGKTVMFDFASAETCQQQFNGNWFEYYKR
ncbi:MAG: hypothetical protein IJR47_02395 [Clostridia bacterium]|nr:hypothetical protein [Clostridia bacterium]